MMHPRPIAVDAFCGAGGLSLGLLRAGFEIVIAFDANVHAVGTYRRNFSHPCLQEDVRLLDGRKLLAHAARQQAEPITLLAGGPPCQGFSIQRRGSASDERNDLVHEYFRLVKELRPRFFLLENVPGLKNNRGRDHLQRLLKQARDSGYVCQIQILNAADFGVPQIRKRLFVVGELTEGDLAFAFPEPSVAERDWATVSDALKGLPLPPKDGSPDWKVANHQTARMSELNIRRIAHVPQGGGWEHLPENLRLPCHRLGAARIGHRYVYGRLHGSEPAGTITAKFDSFTRGKFAHPFEDRSITLREGARLQTFPDSFVFDGPKEEIAAQIGNAVPPLLAEALGRSLLAAGDFGEQSGLKSRAFPTQLLLPVLR
jgi:DNA (cytosine-5)-methyltransferase 1